MLAKKLIILNLIILACLSVILFSLNRETSETVGIGASRHPSSRFKIYKRWPNSKLPLNIVAPESMRKEMEEVLISACNTWNKGAKRKLLTYSFEDYDPDNFLPKKERVDLHRIYFVKNWSKIADKDYLAQTMSRMVGSTMKRSTIVFNGNYNFYFQRLRGEKSIAVYQYDAEAVLLHELGHLLGLDHSSSTDAIMRTDFTNGQKIGQLSSSDIAEIKKRYNR